MTFVERIDLIVEKYGCVCAGLAAVVLSWVLLPRGFFCGNGDFFKELLSTYATIATILSGMAAAASSNFMTHSSNTLLSILKKHKLFLPIIAYANRASVGNAVVTIFSMTLLFMLKCVSIRSWMFYLCCVWIGAAVYGFAAFIRISIIFCKSAKKTLELEDDDSSR